MYARGTMIYLLTLAAALTACRASSGQQVDLAGTEWSLTALNGEDLLEGSYISLTFKEEFLTGFSGCNAYGGEYTVSKKSALAIPDGLDKTEMGCLKPEGVLEQEEAYINALWNAAAYRVEGDRLAIEDDAGETVLAFTLKAKFPMNPADLVGTRWLLVSMDGRSPLEGSNITLVFDREGEFSGHAGCRDYYGTYTASSEGIRSGSLGMKQYECLRSEAFMLQEGEYTDHFTWMNAYRLNEGQLELFTIRGGVLVYVPLEE